MCCLPVKDFDGAISKLFIESAKSISYTSLLEGKHLRRGAQMATRNEAEAQLCPWGLLCPSDLCREVLVRWCLQNGSVPFWRLLKSRSYVIKDLVTKSIPGSSVSTQVKAQPFPLSLLGPSGLGHTPRDPRALNQHFRAPSFCAVSVFLKFALFPQAVT